MADLFIFLIVFAACFILWCQQTTKIERKIKSGFPLGWEKIIKEDIAIYHTLAPEMQARFKARIHRFILTKRIFGYQVEIDDRLRIMVAASAVMMTLTFEHWNFSYLNSIMIVDGPLNDDTENGQILGQLKMIGNQSQMILSKQSLIVGFENLNDRKNVAVHEFAHAVDHADGVVDGIPKSIMPPELVDDWLELIGSEIKKISHKRSDINSYGATNDAEFFAVASEYFFEKPDLMKRKHPELYEILVKTYQQDISESFKVDFKALMGKLKERVGRNSPCPCASGKKFKKCCLRK